MNLSEEDKDMIVNEISLVIQNRIPKNIHLALKDVSFFFRQVVNSLAILDFYFHLWFSLSLRFAPKTSSKIYNLRRPLLIIETIYPL